MNKKSVGNKEAAEKLVKNIRRRTSRKYSAEEKIRIVLAGLRGEESIAALCRREGIAESLYCKWSKEFLEVDGCSEKQAPEGSFIIGPSNITITIILRDWLFGVSFK